ncbi:MAG: DJ-1/PfpI family protein [Rhodospirillales bacterium]
MRQVAALVFPGFELLDLYGPLEMFGLMPEDFSITLIAQTGGPVASRAGPISLAERSLDEAGAFDILLVPGGPGTRQEVDNKILIDWIARAAKETEIVASVCTGAALLARSGLLDGRRATTNKRAWAWSTSQGPAGQSTDWQPKARWVADGSIWTSSGVAAGIDMSLALIAELTDERRATETAAHAEYDWHRDASWDPFAALYGLGS